jgi:tetratricopeptide (TPR) repeat protein
MKPLNTLVTVSLCYLIFLLFIGCGSDPAVEGQKALNNGEYAQAILKFNEAKKKDPNNTTYDEKIALAFMLQGKKLYERTKNIQSFSGNFDKGFSFIPEEPSTEFRIEFSKILFSIGKGYLDTSPENEIQKQEYLTKGMDYLESAVANDEKNEEAKDLLVDFKSKNLNKMMDKGKEYYNKAKKTGNNDLYLTSEYYFKKAVYFDPDNQEAKEYLSKIRKETMKILNIQEDLTFAIADQLRNPDNLMLDLDIHNYTDFSLPISVNNFELKDIDGNTYSLDKVTMNKFPRILKDQEVGGGKTVSGIIAFKVTKNVKLESISYTRDNGEMVKKYFP